MLYARQNFFGVACTERLARVRGLGTGVDGISCKREAVLLASDRIGYNHNHASNGRFILSVGLASRKFDLLRQRV